MSVSIQENVESAIRTIINLLCVILDIPYLLPHPSGGGGGTISSDRFFVHLILAD